MTGAKGGCVGVLKRGEGKGDGEASNGDREALKGDGKALNGDWEALKRDGKVLRGDENMIKVDTKALKDNVKGGGPRVVVSTAAFHARIRFLVSAVFPSMCKTQY